MSIRAKFRVETVNRLMNPDGVSFSEELQMSAVYSSEERSENISVGEMDSFRKVEHGDR